MRLSPRAGARRHELSDLPPGRAADRRRLPDGRYDEPDLLQRGRPAERPPTACHVCLEGARLLLDFRQSDDAIHPGGGLGNGVGYPERHQDCRRLGRRRGDRRKRFSCGTGLCLDLPGARRPQHRQQPVGDLDLPGHRPRRLRDFRGARPGFWHSGAEGGRQRLPGGACRRQMGDRARAAQSRADARGVRHLPSWSAFDLGRSLRLQAENRVRRLAARRSGHPAEEPSHQARIVERGTAQAGRGRGARHRDHQRRRKPRNTARCMRAASLRRATCSRASTRPCPRT